MDEEQLIKKPSKFDRVNLISKAYCTWIYSMFIKGLKRDVEVNDLYKCPVTDESEELVQKLEKNWNQELKKKKPSFTKATIKTFLLPMLPSFCLFMFEECFLKNIQPVLLGYVVRFFANPKKENFSIACLSAAGVVGASLLYITCHHPACVLAVRVAIKARVTWCTLMYKKALKLKHSAFGKTTIGQILNLMSNDVSRFDEYCILGSYMFVAPMQTIIGIYICWLYIGPVCLVGLAIILLLFIPFNSLMGRLFLKIRTKVAALSDNRIRLMNEIIKGMRVIKMYAWEKHFANLISEARKKEMSKIRQATLLRALNISISVIAARVILFTIFIIYVLMGGHLKAEPVFVVMSIFNTLRHTMTWFFPQTIALAAEIYVSCGRVQRFLLLEEIEEKVTEHDSKEQNDIIKSDDKNEIKINGNIKNNESNNNIGDSVIVNNITAKWNPDSEQTTLKNISLRVKPGELLAVIGPVGAGKSSFLMSLLNEIQLTSGSVTINGRIAYASQESWSFNSSILMNIMFGKPYEQKRFKDVISVCAMQRDLKLFPYAEKTLVGERGVSLSGGQKARITLARALYNDADIYLLDDPLSAVDSEVANHIFEKCITEYLKSKTVILVTHQIQFIKKASKILVLKEGKPLAFGAYDELIESGIDFMSLIKEEKLEKETKNDEMAAEDFFLREQLIRPRTLSVLSVLSKSSEVDIETTDPKIEEENKAVGSIDAKVYWNYIRAGAGPILLTLAVVSTLISQSLFHYSDIWLSEWTNREDARNESSGETIDESDNIIIYGTLVATTFISLIIRSGTFFMMCIIASINLHNKIFFQLMRAPIAFFDNNPVGRILNRFTKDVGIVDEQLPLASYDLNLIVTQIIGTIVVVSLVNWYLIIPSIIMIILILQVRWIYIKTGRDLKRFEGMARSPIYNHMTTTLSGLATIRAFRAQKLFREQYYRYQNDHTATYFLCFTASRALGVIMDWLCIAYIFSVALFLMIFHEGLPSGSAGLAFSMALGMTGMTQWGVRQSAEVENQMTSVERILEYSRLDTEAELETNNRPPADWPQEGSIKLSKVYLTYENSPKSVLFDLNCEIRGGEKVGIVGRTGAGKSSILAALFRMHEIEGNIYIDGIDCKTIGLHDLRKKMSIIPQDPIAFIGSLRKNLDPFDEHEEDKIWNVLEEVQLKEAVNEMPGKLEYQLSESGGNLSVGQRQLICLARAILRRNKILVLDEATANVDHKTDSLIQKTIRENFASCTVLTIAHRLNTIIDSDRVLVLDAGKIVEFDKPYILLQNNNGLFFKLVKQTGIAMATELFKAAKDAFDKTNINHQQNTKSI